MNIERQAAVHFRSKTTTTNALFDSYGWQPSNKTITLTADMVKDFYNDGTHHIWTVSIKLDELRRMIEAVAEGMSPSDVKDIGAAMSPSLPAMLKIAKAAAECPGPSNQATMKP